MSLGAFERFINSSKNKSQTLIFAANVINLICPFVIFERVEWTRPNLHPTQSLQNCERQWYLLDTMTLDQDFEAAAESIKSLTQRPTDEELLELYALFKQGSIGDVNTSKPGMLDLKGKAKWNQWSSKKGMTQDAAKEAYIAYAKTLVQKYK